MKNKYYFLIIPIILFICLSFWQFFSSSSQQRKESTNNVNKQVILCEKSIEDNISDFEESAKYDFAERTYQILLDCETAPIPAEIKNKYVEKEKSRIKKFSIRYKSLISKIEVFNENAQRILVRTNDDNFEVSEIQKNRGSRTLLDMPKLIENNTISYIQPVHEPGGKLVANVQFYLKIDEFLASEFDKFYIGENAWKWAIDSTGNVIFHKFCGEEIDSNFETDASQQFRMKLFDNVSASMKHSITTDKKTDVYSVFYPIHFLQKKIGIVFSVDTNNFGNSQNTSIFSIFIYFLSTIIAITILFVVILSLFYRKK